MLVLLALAKSLFWKNAAVNCDEGADAPGTTAAAAVHVAEEGAVAPELASATVVNHDAGAAVNCDEGADAPGTAKKLPAWFDSRDYRERQRAAVDDIEEPAPALVWNRTDCILGCCEQMN